MTTTYSSYNTETCGSLSPVAPRLPGKASSVLVPDEASPLLQPEPVSKSRRTPSERWHSTASEFLDTNAGLLLIMAAQFLFSASNLAVKWLNSSGERIPMLEVRDVPRTVNTL
jgi:hypothetical protein